MSKSFFDFHSDLPSLGCGKDEVFGGELSDAPYDDYDQLNDETFGDAATEGDWEEQHKRFAGELGGRCGEDEDHSDVNGSALDGFDTYKITQDELENSLTRMVVEDDDAEPDYHSHGKAIPMGRKAVDVDSMFGPSSPPGLLNTGELAGGQNIWGSPVRDNYIPRQEDGLKNLLKVLQKPKAIPLQQPYQDPSIVTAVKSLSLPNARTLEEIEHDLRVRKNAADASGISIMAPAMPKPGQMTPEPVSRMSTSVPRSIPRTAGPGAVSSFHELIPKAPVIRTLEDIEQEMTQSRSPPRKVPSPPQPGFPFPIGTPPHGQGFMGPSPKSMPVSIPGGMAGIGLPNVNVPPPPMPTPGHLSRHTNVPPPPHGSPGMGPLTILQRNTPPPPFGMRNTPPSGIGGTPGPPAHPPKSQPHRSSPVFMMNQGRQGGNHGEMAGSPVTHRPGGPHRPPGERSTSPLDGTPFAPRTPQHPRMPPLPMPPHSDPTHQRGPRGPYNYPGPGPGHFPGPNQNINQALFAGPHGRGNNNGYRGRGHDGPNFRGRDDHGYHDNNYRGGQNDFNNYHSREDFGRNNRDEYYRGRGDYHNHGRGDFNPRFMRGGPGNRGYHGYHHENYPHRPRYNSYGEDEMMEENGGGDRDEYAGLMTKKEKDWVIKIQLMQLQTENPYLDDYYYTSWSMKRLAKERLSVPAETSDGQKAEPKLVIPHLARVETKGYKPVQFENSLGRVTASSVHNPRLILDIKRTPSLDQDDAKAREVRKFKELLLDIEKGYDSLLDVDDIEKKALGVPEESREILFEERRHKIQGLLTLIQTRAHEEDGLSQILVVRKGLLLICRLLPLLPQAASQELASELLQNISIISKKDWQKELLPLVYRSLMPVIKSADLEILVHFTHDIRGDTTSPENNTNTILTNLQNKFGSSVLWCMLNRGEVIYATQSPVDMDIAHQQAWNEFVNVVATTLASLSKDNLPTPYEGFPKVSSHVQRVIDKRTFLTVEDKLQMLMVPPSVS